MKHNFLKYLLPTTASLVAFTSISFADVENAQMRNLENRVSSLEQRRGATGVINPPAYPQIKNGADLFVTGDLLYWQAHEDGLPLFVKNDNFNTNLNHSTAEGLRWDWNFGWRFALGYNTGHDGWDISATWLHFNTEANKHEKAHNSEVLWPSLSHPAEEVPGGPLIGAGPFQKAKAHWAMNLNQIDLDLGREFYVSKWLTLRPHLGLRTAWVRQHLKVHYNRLSDGAGSFSSGIDDHIKMETSFWGIGLESGINTQWGLGRGWSIYGDAGFAFLYGFHEPDRKDEVRFGIELDWVNMDWSSRTTRAIADLGLGLRFDSWTNDERIHFRIQAGWEHHIYFSQNQFARFVDDVAIGNFIGNQGDLTLQGWTLSARLDF